jgi:mono/diheme cytochrome c family protein
VALAKPSGAVQFKRIAAEKGEFQMRFWSRFTGLLLLVLPLGARGYSQQKPMIEHAPPPYSDPTSGSEMYRTYCAVCHGLDGKGDGPAAAALKRMPPDLTLLAKKNGGDFPTFRVSNIITGYTAYAAHGSREMPMWGYAFRENDAMVKLRIHNLIQYLGSLQQK